MKKTLIITALIFMISSFTVYGDYENINVKVDGENVGFSYGMPFRDSSERIYVPAKDIIPALYGKYVWLSETDELYVARGSAKFLKNSTPGDVDLLSGYGNYMIAYFKEGNERIAYGAKRNDSPRTVKTVFTDCKPVFYNGTLYLPVRYIANVLGYTVSWDEESKTVICTDTGTQIDITYAVPDTEKTDVMVRSALETLFTTNSLTEAGRNLSYAYFNGTADENQRTDTIRIAGFVKYKAVSTFAKGYLTDGGFGGFIMQMAENNSEDVLIRSILSADGASEEFIQYANPATEADREFLQQYIWDLSLLGL